MTQDDFKYMMQDLYRLYFGVKCTYREILQNEDAYYKFKAVVRQYLIREVDEDTTIESHLYYLEKDSESFRAYRKMKTKVTCMVPDTRRPPKEDGKPYYRQEVFTVDDLVKVPAQTKERMGVIIQEIVVSKMGLAALVV